MSSNSSATEGPVAALLDESLGMLAREQPALHARMCAQLQHRAVEVRVDAERFFLCVTPDAARVDTAARPSDARIHTGRRAIADVLGARVSLAEAVLADRVELIAPLDTLLVLHEGLVTYVHGAVRCPSFPALLARLQAVCREAPSSSPPGAPDGRSHP